MASPASDGTLADKKIADPGSDVAERPNKGRPIDAASANLTGADWKQAQAKPKTDSSDVVARGIVPDVSLPSEVQNPAQILVSAASAEEKLKAAESLARAGQTQVEVVDVDGSKRTLSIQLEAAGKRTMVHVFANDDQGRDHVVLRAVKNTDGSYEHQRDQSGRQVGYYGDWWSKNMGDHTAFADKTAPTDRPGNDPQRKTEQEPNLYDPRRNEIGRSTDAQPNGQGNTSTDAAPVDLYPSRRNELGPRADVQTVPSQASLDSQTRTDRQPPAAPGDIPPKPQPPAYAQDNSPPLAPAISQDVRPTVEPRPLRAAASPVDYSDNSYQGPPLPNLGGDENARLNSLFDGVARRAGYSRQLTRLDNGAVYFRSKMDVDADGSPRARQIDPYGQSNTSLRHENGRSVNAESTHYFVLPAGRYKQFGVHLGDVAAVRYGDQVRFAVFADVGPSRKLGEGSMALARSLGMSSSPISGGTQRPEVEYLVFPRSGNGTPLQSLAHENLGRHYLGKTYRQVVLTDR